MPNGLNVVVGFEVIDPGEVIVLDVVEPITRHSFRPRNHISSNSGSALLNRSRFRKNFKLLLQELFGDPSLDLDQE
jgi:hypothetical protein